MALAIIYDTSGSMRDPVRDETGHPLHSADAVAPGALLDIEFADGRVTATADSDRPAPTPEPPAQTKPASREAKPAPRRVAKPVDQGSLF